METIAIIGRPGCGKTTISKYILSLYNDISYLSVDEITKQDLNYLNKRNSALEDISNGLFLEKNEVEYKDYVRKVIREFLEKEKEKGTKYVLIDFTSLHKIADVWSTFDYKILINREKLKRYDDLILRSGDDLAFMLEKYGEYEFDNETIKTDFTLNNNGNIEDLYMNAKIVFEILRGNTTYYSYFIIKPDGIKNFPYIYNMICNNFRNCNINCYQINDYSSIIKNIYYDLFENNKIEINEKWPFLISALNSLYGNKGVLVLISKKATNKCKYIDFIKEVYHFKQIIRKEFMNSNIRIMIKTSKNYTFSDSIIYNGEPYFVALNKLLSIVHCPDPNIKETIEELKILIQEQIISKGNYLDHLKSF